MAVTEKSQSKLLEEFVSDRIKEIGRMGHEGRIKVELANLRRGVGKKPGELPLLWGALLQDFPTQLIQNVKDGKPSKAEWAAYLALTLYALHQQGHDVKQDSMYQEGQTLGNAVQKLGFDIKDENGSILRRFQILATSSDIEELSHHLRGMIQLLSRAGIGLDYGILSKELYQYQFVDGAERVRLKWGRDYFSNDGKKEKSE